MYIAIVAKHEIKYNYCTSMLVVVCVHMDHVAMDCHSWLAVI